MDKLYLPRRLLVEDKAYSEEELLRLGSVFIVLAEPGAGKTDLLAELGSLLGTKPIRAGVFRGRHVPVASTPLVIDAMDEVARIDRLALNDIVVRASDTRSDKVVFAGRSSEWDRSVTEHVKDCFGAEPVVVRLEPFKAEEQRQLFEAKFPGEVFDEFAREAGRFELEPLLGNPQFLLLFGEAYVESGHSFTSKKAIFADAVRRLAHEASKTVSQTGRPPLDRIIEIAGQVFAKLMLSGASGVCTIEALDAGEFPYLPSLASDAATEARHLVDTRLLKPSSEAGQHEPVHRIVAEYCAARYLVGRIDEPRDRLSLRRILAIIAPNHVVRTELRGMLGWMAALSRGETQTALVELDPYAVFANGDPSELNSAAKKTLLAKLTQVAKDDPNFRRSDIWRQFNVGGFFTADIQADVALILQTKAGSPVLIYLIIELISSSGSASQFKDELRTLAMDAGGNDAVRRAAHQTLMEAADFDPLPDLNTLLTQGSPISLEFAASTVRKVSAAIAGVPVVVDLLRSIAELYPAHLNARDDLIRSRYFIRKLTNTLDLPTVVAGLNDLTLTLACTCNPGHDSLCECRGGVSKIAGLLLDRYFVLGVPHDAEAVWGWLKNLRFSAHRGGEDCASVAALGSAHELRRQIQWLALTEDPSPEKVGDAMSFLFAQSTHAGIRFHSGDMEAQAARAFAEDNVTAWGVLWCAHNPYNATKRSNAMRTLQREHARLKNTYMAEWARQTASRKEIARRNDFRFRSRRRRYEVRDALIADQNRSSLLNDRRKIEAGEHWGWLHQFATDYLFEPQNLTANPDYGDTPIKALRNCIPFLTPHVPTLQALALGGSRHIAQVLVAHCILRFREGRPLDDLSQPVLRAVATEMAGYPTIKDTAERKALESEFERLVFSTPGAVEDFAKDFIEPTLGLPANSVTNIHWLNDKPAFHRLRVTLPLEWLEKRPEMNLQTVRALFQMAADHADRTQLSILIDRRFNDQVGDSGLDTEADKLARALHHFWALNAFFYATACFHKAWEELRQDRDNLLAIHDRIGFFGDEEEKVPAFSAETIYLVVDGFIGQWPKVPLPSSFGSASPRGERAYRFLDRLVMRLGSDVPSRKLPVIEMMLEDGRFSDFQATLLATRAEARRQLALQDFKAPSPADVCALLDRNEIASVEDLRVLLVEQLDEMQAWLQGIETDPIATFYDGGKHVDENTGRNRVVDFLRGRMTALGLSTEIERHMANGNRCDFTVSASISAVRHLLVVEVKGQWHPALFTAASAQLEELYTIHPDAAGQGIFLVFWFGDWGDSIAGKIDPAILSANQLKQAILSRMREELKAVIDVVVLDVSRPLTAPKPTKKRRTSPAPS